VDGVPSGAQHLTLAPPPSAQEVDRIPYASTNKPQTQWSPTPARNGPNSRLQTPAHDALLSKRFRILVPLHLRQNPYNQILVNQETKLDENDLDRPLRAKGVLIEVALVVPGGDHGNEARTNDGGVEELGEAGSAFGGIGDCGLEFCWFRATSDVVV
jgi:hypothetical protein